MTLHITANRPGGGRGADPVAITACAVKTEKDRERLLRQVAERVLGLLDESGGRSAAVAMREDPAARSTEASGTVN
ncbi:MAG: hypothetical protein FJX76_21765 [Armatimonadetes bacterium]|nr:hypothetical protein [Armatimonadota bacterium]